MHSEPEDFQIAFNSEGGVASPSLASLKGRLYFVESEKKHF